jgi:hypothetical protein
MTRNLLRNLSVIALLAISSVPATAQEKSVTSPTADTYVRKNNTTNYGAATTMELQTYTNADDATKSTDFVGLMSFEFTTPNAGYAVKSASLRLVTERIKGDANINIYAFNGDFTESAKYADMETYITAARATAPIATFKMAGEWNKSIVYDAIDDGYKTVSAWTNTIDLSDYVKTLSGNKFSILITRTADANNSNKIFTKEATDFSNAKDATITFAAADIIPQLTVEYEKDEAQKTSATTATADTYVRLNNTTNHGAEKTMEIKTYTDATDATKNTDFVGLMTFQFPSEALTKTIKSATIRLVTERIKGDANMNIYAYAGTFAEDAKYTDQTDNIVAARATTPIATFKMAGEWNKANGSDALGDAYKTLSAWTNTIDVTNYVKTLTTNTFNVMISAVANNNNSAKFYTKEATDVVNAKDATVTFAATDLVPQFTVVYEDTATGIESVDASSSTNAAVQGIFTLQGMRIDHISQPGIYIVNGKKMIVRK